MSTEHAESAEQLQDSLADVIDALEPDPSRDPRVSLPRPRVTVARVRAAGIMGPMRLTDRECCPHDWDVHELVLVRTPHDPEGPSGWSSCPDCACNGVWGNVLPTRCQYGSPLLRSPGSTLCESDGLGAIVSPEGTIVLCRAHLGVVDAVLSALEEESTEG